MEKSENGIQTEYFEGVEKFLNHLLFGTMEMPIKNEDQSYSLSQNYLKLISKNTKFADEMLGMHHHMTFNFLIQEFLSDCIKYNRKLPYQFLRNIL